MSTLKRRNKRGAVAIGQIVVLVVSIIAFSYFIGSEFKIVSAESCTLLGDKVSSVNVNSWCTNNGGDSVCTGGSGNWQLKTVTCPTDARIPNAGPTVATVPGATGTSASTYLKMAGAQTVTTVMVTRFNTLVSGGLSKEAAASQVVSEIGAAGTPVIPPGAAGTGATKTPGFWSKYWGSGGSLQNTLATAAVVAIIVIAWRFVATWDRTGSAGWAAEVAGRTAIGAAAGIGVYTALVVLTPLGPAGWMAGLFVGAGIWLFDNILKKEKDRVISFECKPWQAQTGGTNCEKCNAGDFPCTEYQCRSLGTGCEIINKDTDEPECIYKNPRDVNPPVITPWKEILMEGYAYNPLPRGQNGVEIKYQNEECLPAFTPFSFGISLDKPGYCRAEFEMTKSFDDMTTDFGGDNRFKMNHNQIFTFPGVANIQDFLDKLDIGGEAVTEILNDGEYGMYVRCQAASNGKANREEFVFKFCVDKGPDTGAPEIYGFNWKDGSPVGYFGENEAREVGVQVYVNEPAKCKWDHEDKDYEDMGNSLSCSDSIMNFNAQLSYTCSGKLTGLENNAENDFFFRCEDLAGNVNGQSTKLSLQGTRALVIDKVSPNNTVMKDSTNSIKVTLGATTSAGFDNKGTSTCYSSLTGASGSYMEFSKTNSYNHSTNVWLGEGDYKYNIRCIDSAGNSDTKIANFTVIVDTKAPLVGRVFRQENKLKVITNEESYCVYGNVDCSYSFTDGTNMSRAINGTEHSTAWNTNKVFYIKCSDMYGNQPYPNQCNIIARPFDIPAVK